MMSLTRVALLSFLILMGHNVLMVQTRTLGLRTPLSTVNVENVVENVKHELAQEVEGKLAESENPAEVLSLPSEIKKDGMHVVNERVKCAVARKKLAEACKEKFEKLTEMYKQGKLKPREFKADVVKTKEACKAKAEALTAKCGGGKKKKREECREIFTACKAKMEKYNCPKPAHDKKEEDISSVCREIFTGCKEAFKKEGCKLPKGHHGHHHPDEHHGDDRHQRGQLR